MPDAVQLLADREAIADLIHTYARGVDQRDFDTVRDCFAPDLRVLDWGPGNMDREETMAYIAGVTVFRSTMHMMGNQLVHVTGDDATSVTRALLTHTWPDERARHEHAPVYVERLARREGRWWIVERGGTPVVDGPAVGGITSDDAAVQWLLDRAAVTDVLSRDDERFLGSRVVLIDGDEADAWSVAFPIRQPMPAGVEPEASVDHLVRTVDGWRRVDRRLADGPPPVAAPVTNDPLVDRIAVRDAVVRARWTGAVLVNNQQVHLDGDHATVTSYAYVAPAWGEAPEVWVDELERRDDGWHMCPTSW